MASQDVLGFLMIGAGLCLVSGGVVVLVRGPDRTPAPLDEPARELPTREEKGRSFEGWVVRKFNPKYFTIQEWRGDKSVAGIHAESSRLPDLEIEFRLRDRRAPFAVECKWRRSFQPGPKPGLEWATPGQIETYQEFRRKRGIPVFVAIGIGGEPDAPAELYVLPLDRLKYPFASVEYPAKFRRGDPKLDFFFDPETSQLR